MKIFVVGYFGRNNLGDETILEVFLEWAQRNLDAPDFRVLSAAPAETEKRHMVSAVPRASVGAILSAIRWCDVVLAPGGGLLQDSTSARSAYYYAWLLRTAHFFKKPVYMLSQGIGPLGRERTRRSAASALAGCRRVWVRDKGSASVLAGEEGAPVCEVSADMVFMLRELLAQDGQWPVQAVLSSKPGTAPGAVKVISKKSLRIGVSLRPCGQLEKTAAALLGALIRMADAYLLEVHLFAFDAGEDSGPVNSFAEELRRRAPGISFYFAGELKDRPPSAGEVLRNIAGMDLFVGMRLHSLVFSSLAGTPFVALPYDPKVSAFAKICRQPAAADLESISAMGIQNMADGLLKTPKNEIAEALADITRTGGENLGGAMAELKSDLENIPTGPQPRSLGIPVSPLSFNATIRKILETARRGDKLHIVTVNPEMIMRTRREPEFRDLLRGGTMNTPDGVGVRTAVRMKYRMHMEPVTGVDITTRLLEISRAKALKIFMLGGKPEVIGEVEKMAKNHPARPLIAGTHHGYLNGIDMAELAAEIKSSGADVVLVGMGVPLQEYWIRDNAVAAGASVYLGVGGVFDVLSGKTVRAPAVFRKTGMEWLWRLAGQPSRIKRLISFPFFILLALMDSLRGARRDT